MQEVTPCIPQLWVLLSSTATIILLTSCHRRTAVSEDSIHILPFPLLPVLIAKHQSPAMNVTSAYSSTPSSGQECLPHIYLCVLPEGLCADRPVLPTLCTCPAHAKIQPSAARNETDTLNEPRSSHSGDEVPALPGAVQDTAIPFRVGRPQAPPETEKPTSG